MKCRAANPEEQTFCLNCHTRLPKRYLRVVNFSEQEFAVGDILADRFVFRGPQVVMDIRPGLLLESDYELPSLFVPYLKLFPHRIHYSQFFTILWVGEENEKAPILLLEHAPLSPNDLSQTVITEGDPNRPAAPLASALPLAQAWPQAQPVRQLNWLWQIAHLWDDFIGQGVGQSLISPALLRVEGPILRILELHNDLPEAPPTLSNLGAMLSKFKTLTSGSLNFLFSELCDDLISEKIDNTQDLITRIENAIVTCRESDSLDVSLATLTDPGVVRKHNEDQCFPPSGSYIQNSSSNADSLLIVCDGVGGHAGGEVASATAIEALQEHIGDLVLDALSPAEIKQELINASCHANDLISQRNDEEQRQERARMGTTLVMALIHNQQLYVSHIGDSRAYLITKVGCYQLTVDDDIASREVRLGYLPYNEALRQPTSGSLVQALGMASSQTLHPTVQRFILDDECILLLCSDGLSDYDRVEELWQEELLPLLYRNYDLASVSERLITLANHLNGHDNVTVGIMSISRGNGTSKKTIAVKRENIDVQSTVPNLNAPAPEDETDSAWLPDEQAWVPETPEADQKTRQIKKQSKKGPSPFILGAIIGLLLAVFGGTVWAGLSLLRSTNSDSAGNEPPLESDPSETAIETLPEIKEAQFLQVTEGNQLTIATTPPSPISDITQETRLIASGSILKTIKSQAEKNATEEYEKWFQVELCQLPDQTNDLAQEKNGVAQDSDNSEIPALSEENPSSETSPILEAKKGSLVAPGEQAWVKLIDLQTQTKIVSEETLPTPTLGICNSASGNAQTKPQNN